MTYAEIVRKNADKAEYYFMKIIDNSTLQIAYSVLTNLHLDHGVCSELFSHYHGASKRQYRKIFHKVKNAGNFKVKLHKTDNDANYTRIIWRLAQF